MCVMLLALVAPLAAAVALPPAPLDDTGRLDADVAVVADRVDLVLVDAVRAAVFAAVHARGARVVDLHAQGLKPALDACVDLQCRRDLARRRGAEWHVVVEAIGDDGATVVLALLDGPTERAHVVLTGPRVMLLGGVPDAVDALFEAALPRGVVERERTIARARALAAAGEARAAQASWAEAFALGRDDRAIEITFERARHADEVGNDDAVAAAWDDAEAALLDAPDVSAAGRRQLAAALVDHHWQRAERAAAIASADQGPDHDALAATAAALFARLLDCSWVPDDVRARAAEQAATLRRPGQPAMPVAPAAVDDETPAPTPPSPDASIEPRATLSSPASPADDDGRDVAADASAPSGAPKR